MEALAQRYPDDDEAQISYAITLNVSASLNGKTDANQLKGASIGEGVNRIERTEGTAAALRLSDFSVTLDTGKAVVKDAEVGIMPGERVIVAGSSGTGKSTLVRAIAGLWPWGEGKRSRLGDPDASSLRYAGVLGDADRPVARKRRRLRFE